MKEQIKKRFDLASHSYEQVASIQKKCAYQLVSMLRMYYNDYQITSILDVGTGTGYIPAILQKQWSASQYTLNDLSEAMLNVVQEKFKNNPSFSFRLGDIETLPIDSYQLIISNLSIQWVDNIEKLIKKLYAKSNLLAFSCLTEGTFKQWGELLSDYNIANVVKKYPSVQEFTHAINILQPKRQNVITKDFTLTFSNPLQLMRYLKKLGATYTSNVTDVAALHKFAKYTEHKCILEYKVMFVLLER